MMNKNEVEAIPVAANKTVPPSAEQSGSAAPKFIAAALFGLTFGFLLQKGGVGKFNVLIGQLLLQDFTVAKVMLTAIVVGMVGVFTLRHFAKVNLHIKPTRLGANIIGGLLFGVGFALLGYCPGTVAVALGQGSWDALFGMVGLVAGSWIFAELSGWSKLTVEKWGDLGKVTLPDLLRLPVFVIVMGQALVLVTVLLLLDRFNL